MSGGRRYEEWEGGAYDAARRSVSHLLEGLRYPVTSEHSFAVLLLGGILLYPVIRGLIVPQILVAGYLVDVLKRTIRADATDRPDFLLPELSDPVAFVREGAQATLLLVTYAVIPQAVFALFVNPSTAVADNPDAYLNLLSAFFPTVGVLNSLTDVWSNIETSGLLLELFEVFPFLRPYRDQIPLTLFTLVLAYATPAALSLLAESERRSVLAAVKLRNLRPILTSPNYFVGWMVALPLFVFQLFLLSRWTELAQATLPMSVGFWALLLLSTFGFYTQLATFYLVGRVYRDVRTARLAGHADEVVEIFRSPSTASVRGPTTEGDTAPNPGVEWFEESVHSRFEFRRNRQLIHAWIRRILPKDVMYQLRSPYGVVGHRVPEGTLPLPREISVEGADDPVTLYVWYS